MQKRISYFFLFFYFFMAVTMLRYIYVQIFDYKEMKHRLDLQVEEKMVTYLPRGTISGRNGRQLAVSIMTDSLFVDPSHVKDPEAMATDLAPLIHMKKEEILRRINLGGGFVWLARRMDSDESAAVHKLIKEKNYQACLGFRKEAKRYYPNQMLASNVIGFVGTDNEGLDGIEQSMNRLLKGQIVETSINTDTFSRPILDSLFNLQLPSSDQCKNVTLTIDTTIQFIVEQALDHAMAQDDPDNAIAIVMDPRTGEVLAMASRPSYNPNDFAKYKPTDWKNRAISFVYEPGSTFKAVVAAAALQEKLVRPDDVFVDPGTITIDGRHIQNWNGASFGTVTFSDVVRESLNTGFVHVGLELGGQRLMDYAKKFGFGRKSGIELPGEERGILFNPKTMSRIDVATSSIGQGIAVTPLQMITAMAAIANDGVLLRPHIIKTVYNHDGTVYDDVKPQEVHRCIDPWADKMLVSMLERVVSSGSGSKAAIPGYKIAGKTGTAQKVDLVHGGYLPGQYVASFCGFAPADDPQIAVLVIIDDPHRGSYYGGQVAAPIVREIFSKIFRYLHIPPSVPIPSEGETLAPTPLPREIAPYPKKVPKGMSVVPDLYGKTIREAAQILQKDGFSMNATGSGICRSQTPGANNLAPSGAQVTVNFGP